MKPRGERKVTRGEKKRDPIRKLMVLILFSSLISRHSLLVAAFRDLGWSTRAGGMGGAYAAVSDDAEGALHNPAGLARLETRELALMYAKPFAGLDLSAGTDGDTSLDMNRAAFAFPTRRLGSFGFSWANFNTRGLYEEQTRALSYARGVHDLLWPEKGPELFLGVNLKSLSHEYLLDERTRQTEGTSSASPFRAGTSETVFSVDAGLQVRPLERLTIGLAGRDMNAPDAGLAVRDPVAPEYRLGAAFQAGDAGFFEDLTPALEISYRKPRRNEADLRPLLGVESWFHFHTYALRLGGNDREATFGGSWNRDLSRFSLQLDYAFVLSSTLHDSGGTHRFTLTLRQTVPRRAPEADSPAAEVPQVWQSDNTDSAEPSRPPRRYVPGTHN